MEKQHQWDIIKKTFPVHESLSQTQSISNNELDSTIEMLQNLGVSQIVVNLSLENIWTILRKVVTPKFWKHFLDFSNNESVEQNSSVSIGILHEAVVELHGDISELMIFIQRCSKAVEIGNIKIYNQISPTLDLYGHLKVHLAASLLSQLPACFPLLIQSVYQKAFKVFSKQGGLHDNDESIMCYGCGSTNEMDESGCNNCTCADIMDSFATINKHLRELDLIERLCGSTITDIIMLAIDERVDKICLESYDQKWMEMLEKWLEEIVLGWLGLVNSLTNREEDEKKIRQSLNVIFRPALYQKYTSTRINQLFNIVIEYPESQPVLEDLRECLDKTNLRSVLVTSLKEGIQTRMLHPGVNTLDILNAYISTIKALRILDPEGILLELVSEPIRQYLRGRSDFVRYIVTSLTDDDGSELSDELLVSAPLVLDDSYSEVDDMDNWEEWMPDPMHAQTSVKKKSQRTADIISMLVNIYGSRNVFIIEYQTILADRILTHFNYDTEQEIRYLEHLKVRFGENLAQLHRCEVMVKDVGDSKRINTSIQSSQNPHFKKHSFPVSCLIVSSQFWPQFKDDSLKLPDRVVEEFGIYTDAYQDLKGNRTLAWKPHLGQVHLSVTVATQKLDLMVSPIEATIIIHFEKTPSWSLEDLSREIQVPKAALRRKIAFWQALGVLKESTTDVFVLNETEKEETLEKKGGENGEGSEGPLPVREILDDESESVMASPHEQRQEEMQVLWSYIVGMLTNLDTLPLDRIHSMLKLFVQDAVECSQEELRMFLDAKIREHLIVFSNGSYKLSKIG